MMRVTVVGAILVVAVVLTILVLIQALSEEKSREPNKSDQLPSR
jgi:preprotein translocase subunit SecG